MALYQHFIILTTESLIGEQNILSNASPLDNSFVLSKMRIFYKLKQQEDNNSLDIFNYLKTVSGDKNLYTTLVFELLYLMNFRKKFCQRNVNRIVSNYFKLISTSMKKKANILIIPEQFILDETYLTTIALSNLYSISQFYNNEKIF